MRAKILVSAQPRFASRLAFLIVALLVLPFGVAIMTASAETMYRDPRQRFTLAVPDGWTAAPRDFGANLSCDKAYASLVVMERPGVARDLVSFFSAQLAGQWQNWRELERGDVRFGDQAGTFAVYSGTNPEGVEAVVKIVAVATADTAYALLMSVPVAGFDEAMRRDLARIEQGFTLGSPSPAYRLEALGTAALKRGQAEEARNSLVQSLAMARELPDPDTERRLLEKLGRTYRALEDYPKAIESYQRFLSLARAAGDRQDEAIALGSLGIIHETLKDDERAVMAFQQVLAVARSGRDRSNESTALWHLGKIALGQEDYVRAIECFEQVLAILRELGDRPRQMETLLQLGRSHYYLADYQKAIAYMQQGLALARTLGDKLGQGQALRGLGNGYYFRADPKQAIAYYQQELAIRKELADRGGEGQVLGNLALAYTQLGEFHQAIEYYAQDLAIAREVKDARTEAQALSNLADVYLSLKDYETAIGYYRQSLAVVRTIGYRRGEGITLTNMGRALYQAGSLPQAEAAQREAIAVLESLREKASHVDAYNVSLFESHLQAYRFLQATLIARKQPEAALEIAERGRARALNELLSRRAAASDTTGLALESPPLAAIREIARAHNATLVEYALMPEEAALYIWVVQPTGQVFFAQSDLPSRQPSGWSLDELVRRGRLSLGVAARGAYKVQGEPLPPDQDQTLLLLYRMLIEPVADRLPKDPDAPVIFIPQEALFLVSFAALRDRTGRYLIDQHTVLAAPSIQTLQLTQEQQLHRKPPGPAPLVVGNPTMPWISLGGGATREQLEDLPGAEREAMVVAKLLQTEAITGGRATKSEVLRRLGDARLVHLATHGLLDDLKAQGMPGAIALAPAPPDDGLLTAAEIQGLKLSADLVVLSACDTGRGRITGDGVIGLSRAFISAGAPSVMVSLWRVPDAPTADLMSAFYRHLISEPNKARALRQAMLETRRQHPDPLPGRRSR